jgi:hypothetical protein
MKKCPSCDRTYPDNETFCETDGVALVKADPAFVESGGAGEAIECPVCGGRAEPGEVICNFCGARLISDATPRATPSSSATRRPERTVLSNPPSEQLTRPVTSQMRQPEDEGGGGSFTAIGYVIAALVALVGGAWLALHLSSHQAAKKEAAASPSAAVSPSPAAAAGPLVVLANTMSIQVTGESAAAPERSSDAMRKVFDDGEATLRDAYRRALAGDPTVNDGMIVRVRVMPDGTVGAAAVRTSTAPNPSLDAEVVKDISGWSFPPFSGGQVEVDYPIVFAHDATEQASIESALGTRLAGLDPNEAPEYGASLAPTPAPTPAVVAAPSPVAPAPAPSVARERPHRRIAKPKPVPTPSLRELVARALRSNRAFGRVQYYTNPGGNVVLFGKVFDDKAKAAAARTVRGVPGVTGVVNNLTTDTATWAEQQAQVQARLAGAGLEKVTVKIIGKDAFLSGEVKTKEEKDRAVTITEGAAPVIVRTNLILVKPGGIFGF